MRAYPTQRLYWELVDAFAVIKLSKPALLNLANQRGFKKGSDLKKQAQHRLHENPILLNRVTKVFAESMADLETLGSLRDDFKLWKGRKSVVYPITYMDPALVIPFVEKVDNLGLIPEPVFQWVEPKTHEPWGNGYDLGRKPPKA